MKGAYFAFILSSSASYFFCNSALVLVRFLILSSWFPFALVRSAVLVWRSLTLAVRVSIIWASWYARAIVQGQLIGRFGFGEIG